MKQIDNDIIRKVIGSDTAAFAILVERYSGKGLSLALRFLQNREDAEEALQDAFVRAFHALNGFEFRSGFSTWFYRILYNVCMTAVNRKNRRPTMRELDEDILENPASDPLPDSIAEHGEFRYIVEEEIRRLPPRYGAIVTLFFLGDQSYDEIAHVTGLPLGTVKNRLFRARAALKKAVIRQYGNNDVQFGAHGHDASDTGRTIPISRRNA